MSTASREFQVMAKPIGALCNLGCQYCYYLVKKDLYPKTQSHRMADDLLETYIVQHIEASPKNLIFFSWHGGEATLLGVDYFRRIVELQKKYLPAGRELANGVQTNGLLIDEEWCRFLAAEKFYVGISIDGPRELHDRYRVTKGGEDTQKRVLAAYRMLIRHRIPTDVLCVVNDRNVRQPAAVYRFFKELGVQYLQFLPLVARRGPDGVTAETVPAQAYGEFLCTVFDEWVRNDVGRVAIQNFDEALRPSLGVEHALCTQRETCGDVVVVEHNGDFYSCDHFVTPEHCLGNIRDTSLVELLESRAQMDFGQRKKDLLPGYCRSCEVLASCNGGCPKDRISQTPEGEPGLNYLCAGFKRFYSHSRPYFDKMAALKRSGAPVERIMALLQEAPATSRQAGRNDPCPCGSGKKFKKCCLGKASLGAAAR